MDKIEDDNLNFEEMNLPVEEPADVEIADEVVSVATVDSDVEPVVEPEDDFEGVKKKESDKLHFYLVCAGAAAVPFLLLILASVQMIYPSTAVYLICIGLIPFGLWMTREKNTIFIVFLGCVLAAILTAVYCLWFELGSYDFDIRAKEAKQRVSMTLPAKAVEARVVHIA